MEFNFNINNYFKEEITKVGSRLIPEGFIGGRREIQDCLSKISFVLNVLGEKSAKAQGLQKVITSGEKLRNSDHIVYILIDPAGGTKGYGTVLGMLKVGMKHLYVFDAGGNNHEVTAKCVLDFYVHESKQRMGLGKKLFQYMLQEERIDPVHLAIDKPSPKFLSFLLKHYNLKTVIPQMNNFVVFEGFFSNRGFGEECGDKQKLYSPSINSYGNPYSSGNGRLGGASSQLPHYKSNSSLDVTNKSYYGRPAPHKPISTMGMILQQKPSPNQQTTQNGSTIQKEVEEAIIKTETVEETISEKEMVKETEGETVNEKEIIKETEDETTNETKNVDEEEVVIEEKVENIEKLSETEEENPKYEVKEPSKSPEKESRIGVTQKGHKDLKFYHSSLW